MHRKNIKKMIENGEMVVGMTAQLLDPAVAEIAGWAGFDYVRLEGEHIPLDLGNVRDFIRAADSVGIPLFVRTNRLDDITAMNDLGVAGYQIPHVQNAEQAKMIVDRVKYAPVGARGFARHVRAQQYTMKSFDDYVKEANDEMFLIVQIEDRQGIENMEEIIATEGIDCICSGKGDISQALGLLGQLTHPKVREVEDRIISLAKKYGKKLMILGYDHEDWIYRVSRDETNITEHMIDIGMLADAAVQARKDLQFLKDYKNTALPLQ